eukprot:4396726-Pleurochrysis_carterae.AAC.2
MRLVIWLRELSIRGRQRNGGGRKGIAAHVRMLVDPAHAAAKALHDAERRLQVVVVAVVPGERALLKRAAVRVKAREHDVLVDALQVVWAQLDPLEA